MAPVAGGITYGQEDRLILGFCSIERFVAPGVPINGVMGVLEEIRGFFVYQSV
jgi:hypothetical protein